MGRTALVRFQLTAARRRLAINMRRAATTSRFQLTAARRRLVYIGNVYAKHRAISTHSRAKAAGNLIMYHKDGSDISTHSRAKAAGQVAVMGGKSKQFQLSAARRRLGVILAYGA